MKITLWDLDWYYKMRDIPNLDCMRISSYHKQKGDQINFVEEISQASFLCDKMYIFKELEKTPLPERKFLDDIRTTLIGGGFSFLKHSRISSTVAACRPDYLLYNTPERDAYANANFIGFYAGTELIKLRQDYHNTKKHHKKTLVVDDYFWKAKDEEIIYCLEILKQDKNIAFLEPISLSKLITTPEIKKRFLELDFSRGTHFRWRNDYGHDAVAVTAIVEFMEELRKVTNSDLGFVPIRASAATVPDEADALRCLEVIGIFKRHKVRCKIITGKYSTALLRVMKRWMNTEYQLSFIEFVLHYDCAIQGVLWYDILNSPIRWRSPTFDALVSLLASPQYNNYRDYLFIQWGFWDLDKHKINYDVLYEHMSLLAKGE